MDANNTNGDGANPQAALVLGSDGNFYGTTTVGGSNYDGTVFKITPAGVPSTLYSFTGADGAISHAALAPGNDGMFYGTTTQGGSGGGTVFKITPAGAPALVFPFTSGGLDGSDPVAALVLGKDGNFYGTTTFGGQYNKGTVFQIGSDGTFHSLYSFSALDGNNHNSDGAQPKAGLVEGNDHNFYGTTNTGGPNGTGTVFQITSAGVLTPLHGFQAVDGKNVNGDGANSLAALVLGNDGNFYGTTKLGGSGGFGTVFQITSGGGFNVLHSFSALDGNGDNADGASPFAALVLGRDGNFYGTTRLGGASGKGEVFQITSMGAFNPLSSFSGTDGANPYAALVQGMSGLDDDFYGTTSAGGTGKDGTVFKLALQASAGLMQFSATSLNVNENEGSVMLTVSRVGGTAGAVSVTYSTADGTAVAGTDYTMSGRTLSWADGDGTDKSIPVTITDRQLSDGSAASFSVNLSGPSGGASLGTPSSVTVNIIHSDVDPTIVMTRPTMDTTVVAGSYLDLEAVTTDPNMVVDHVEFFVSGTRFDGVGHNNVYEAKSIQFPTPGTYVIYADAVSTSGKDFPSSTVTVTATIPPTSVQFDPATQNPTTIDENAGSVTLYVSRTGGSIGAITVAYVTADDTAKAGTDYAATGGTLSWADGDTADKTITVLIPNPGVADGGTRKFSVALSAPTPNPGASVGAFSAATVAILDNDPLAPTVAFTNPPTDLTITAGSGLTPAAIVANPGGLGVTAKLLVNGSAIPVTLVNGAYVADAPACVAAGTYTLEATVTDALNRTNSSAVTVTVNAADADPSAPTVSLLTDLDHQVFAPGQTITLAAVVTTADGSPIKEVDFYADGVLIARQDAGGNPILSAYSPTGGATPHRASSGVSGNTYQTSYTAPGADKIANILITALGLGNTSSEASAKVATKAPITNPPPAITLTGLTKGQHLTVGQPYLVAAQEAAGTGASTLVSLQYSLGTTGLPSVPATGDLSADSVYITPTTVGAMAVSVVGMDTEGLFTNTAVVDVIVDEPVVTMTRSKSSETSLGGAPGKITITRTGDTKAPLTVNIRAAGTARPGVDFKPVPDSVTIPLGMSQVKVKIKALENAPMGGTPIVKLKLLPGGYTVGASSSAKIKIVNNE